MVGEVHRLDGAQAETFDFCLAEDPLNQAGEPQPHSRFAPPAAEVDAAQHDLAVTPAQGAHLLDHPVRRHAPAASADGGNDAEGAAVAAAVLNLQVGASAVTGSVLDRRGEKILLREDVPYVDLPVKVAIPGRLGDDLGNARFVGVADNPVDAWQSCQIIGRTLGVAAGHKDPGARADPVRPPDGLAQVVVRFGSDGATVEDDEVGVCLRVRRRHSLPAQKRLQCSAVSLRRPAAKVLYEELAHSCLSILPARIHSAVTGGRRHVVMLSAPVSARSCRLYLKSMYRVLAILLLAASAQANGGIALEEYQARRAALREKLNGSALVLFGAAEDEYGDLRTAFYQESNFYYLTGWSEPGAILALTPAEEVLFIPRRNREREKWTGAKADPFDDSISTLTGFAEVRPSEGLEAWLLGAAESVTDFYALTKQPAAEKLQQLLPLRELKDAEEIIARMRMRKSVREIDLIRRAAKITMDAHRAAWDRMAPGLYEYQIAATMSNVYFDAGCGRHAYAPIVGSGPAGTILHYSRNSRRFDAGELVLMDVGAECARYASDITRTVPANGRFTERQRELYKIVMEAQQAVIGAVKPGMTLGRTGPNSLFRLALDYFNSHGEDKHGEKLGRYFTHGIGHHIGLDVHDPGGADTPLEAGMVITIEPGLYIPEEGIGIRIEDVVLVTEDGGEVLSEGLPKEWKEIERAVRKGK